MVNRFMIPAEGSIQSTFSPLPLEWMNERLQRKQAQSDAEKQAILAMMPDSNKQGLKTVTGWDYSQDPNNPMFNENIDIYEHHQGIIDKHNQERAAIKNSIYDAYQDDMKTYGKVSNSTLNLIQKANAREKEFQGIETTIEDEKKRYEKAVETLSGKELDAQYQLNPVYERTGKWANSLSQDSNKFLGTYNASNTMKYFDVDDEIRKMVTPLHASTIGRSLPKLSNENDFYNYSKTEGVTRDKLRSLADSFIGDYDPTNKFYNTWDAQYNFNKANYQDYDKYYSGRVVKEKGSDGKIVERELTPHEAYLDEQKQKSLLKAAGYAYQTTDDQYGLTPGASLRAQKQWDDANAPQGEELTRNADVKDLESQQGGTYSWYDVLSNPNSWLTAMTGTKAETAAIIAKNKFTESTYPSYMQTAFKYIGLGTGAQNDATRKDAYDDAVKSGKLLNNPTEVKDFASRNFEKTDMVRGYYKNLISEAKRKGRKEEAYVLGQQLNEYNNASYAKIVAEKPIEGTLAYFKNNDDYGSAEALQKVLANDSPNWKSLSKEEQKKVMATSMEKVNRYRNEMSGTYGLYDKYNSTQAAETDKLMFGQKNSDGTWRDNGEAKNKIYSYVVDGKKVVGKSYKDMLEDLDIRPEDIHTIGLETLATEGQPEQTRPIVMSVNGKPNIEIYAGSNISSDVHVKSMPAKVVFSALKNGTSKGSISSTEFKKQHGVGLNELTFVKPTRDTYGKVVRQKVNSPSNITSMVEYIDSNGNPLTVMTTGGTGMYNGQLYNDSKVYVEDPNTGELMEMSGQAFNDFVKTDLSQMKTKEFTEAPVYKTGNPSQSSTSYSRQ